MTTVFVLDRAAILERLGGDQDILAMMLDMYLQDVGNNCTALTEALHSGNAGVLQREAHTVKGLLLTFSDDAGAADAHRIEQRARQGEVTTLAAEVEALCERLREVAAVLRRESAAG